jgi:hypothetical protein
MFLATLAGFASPISLATHFTQQMDGFLAQPERRVFLKPNVTRVAAENYGFDFRYASKAVMV